jgi:hypothetical protein
MIAHLAIGAAFAQDPSDTDVSLDTDPVVDTSDAGPPVDPLLGRPFQASKPGQVDPSSPYWDLEVLYFQEKHLEGAKLAEARYAETGDPHLTLYIARSWYQELEGDESRTKAERLVIYERILTQLDAGLARAPKDMHLQFARGVVMARIGTTKGVLASLRLADDVEGAWTKAIASDFRYHSIGNHEQLPCDAYLGLGIFYRLVPDSWVVKAMAGTKGDLAKSLEMLEKGVACSGDRIRNLKELAVTQLCLGQKTRDEALMAKGRSNINRYLAIVPTMQEEFVDLKHGAALLQDPSIACAYSRDGQQDLDESKLQKP